MPDKMVRRRDRGSESPATPRGDAALERTTSVTGTQYQVGQMVEFSSDMFEAWVPAKVEAISTRAGVKLRLTNGQVIKNAPTHRMRHRSASEIQHDDS